MNHPARTPVWTWMSPVAGLCLFAGATALGFDANFAATASGLAIAVALVPLLVGAVFSAVFHAEDVAHQTGEPVGTLVLTIAVTIIELALIVSLMMAGNAEATLVRDTVYSVIMIILTGIVGLCLLLGGLRYREQTFDITSTHIYLATLTVLASLTLVLPNFTVSAPGPQYSQIQLALISIGAIALYLVFLYTQTVLHKDYFVSDSAPAGESGSQSRLMASVARLVLALIAVVLLAKMFAVVIGVAFAALGAPRGLTGVVIALIVLTPESIAAIKAARQDRLQVSVNLALGSSLATIGLTIPAMAVANTLLQKPLWLGLEPRDLALLVTTLAASILTFGTGRTNVLFGFVHVVLFATFLVFVFAP